VIYWLWCSIFDQQIRHQVGFNAGLGVFARAHTLSERPLPVPSKYVLPSSNRPSSPHCYLNRVVTVDPEETLLRNVDGFATMEIHCPAPAGSYRLLSII